MIGEWFQRNGDYYSKGFYIFLSLWLGLSVIVGFRIATPDLSTSGVDIFHYAYIGPGAGFAFLGSFLSLLAALAVGAASILVWPFRVAWKALTRHKGMAKASVKKIIFLGLDGLDPELCERYMGEGKMPHLSRLCNSGHFSRLRTTFPPLSPVAW